MSEEEKKGSKYEKPESKGMGGEELEGVSGGTGHVPKDICMDGSDATYACTAGPSPSGACGHGNVAGSVCGNGASVSK